MGGRGASTGISEAGNRYGTQYRTLFSDGNVKFVTKNTRQSETLMETMTKGRVYVTTGGDEIQSITYFDTHNKRNKTIHIDHRHIGMEEHVHHGYLHFEVDQANGVKKLATHLTPKEKRMLERVRRLWYNYLRSK